LADASHLLHDAVFLAHSRSHDEKNRCFHLHLWREMPEIYKCERFFLFVNRISFKRAACQLTIHQVNHVAVHITDELDWHSLFSIRYFRNLLVFQTEGAMTLEISVDGLDCRLADTGETAWKQHGYSFLSWSRFWDKKGDKSNFPPSVIGLIPFFQSPR